MYTTGLRHMHTKIIFNLSSPNSVKEVVVGRQQWDKEKIDDRFAARGCCGGVTWCSLDTIIVDNN